MIGREAELRLIRQRLSELRRGSGGCVAVVGEAGIGKTSLLDEALASEPLALTVLRGRAADFEQSVPFGILIDAFDDLFAALEPGKIERLGDDRLADLAAVFPALHRPGLAPLATPAERYRCHYAVRAFAEELARERPLVIALDDAHWADESSVELVAHLLRRSFDAPILLILAYRSRGAPERLVSSVRAAARERRVDGIELGALSSDEARALVGEEVDASLFRRLYEQSGGNPFYLEQLARAPVPLAIGTQPADRGDGSATDVSVPVLIRASLAQEINGLSEPARTLLHGAAVAGEPFDPDLAAIIAEQPHAGVYGALDELIAADLVRPTPTPRRFCFRHPIVGRAVYESTGDGWRLAAHERAVAALRTAGEPSTVIAPHAERCARSGDSEAIEILSSAGRSTAARAPASAVRWFRAALRLLRPNGTPDERLELLIALADALARSGQLLESRAALTEVLAGLEPRATARRARVVTILAQTEAFLGRGDEARRMLERALSDLRSGPARERAAVLLELAVDRLRNGDRDGAASWAVQAADASRQARDVRAACASAALRGLIEAARGDTAAARGHVAEAANLVRRLSNRELANQLVTLFYVAHAEVGLGDYHAAIAHAERGIAVARATGQAFVIVPLMFAVGRAKLALGLLAESGETAEAMHDASRLLRLEQYTGWAASLSASVALQRGDVAIALEAATRAAASTAAAPQGLFAHLGRCVLGEVQIASGRPREGRDEILDAAGGAALPRVEAPARARCYEVLAEAELALGELDRAQEWVRRAEAAGDQGMAEQRAVACRAQATLMLATSQPAAAAELAREAARLFAARELTVDVARAEGIRGQALASVGERAQAVAVLDAAHSELDARDAGRARDEVAQELRRLTRRVPRRTRRGGEAGGGVASLSPRERQVVELVVAGRTNRAIAATLFLSERTVENHLSHVFEKLGVGSRVEVVREISRRDRAEED